MPRPGKYTQGGSYEDDLPPCHIENDYFQYRGYGGCHCFCHLRIWTGLGPGVAVVILTERPDNIGTSITNMSESLWVSVAVVYAGVLAGAQTLHCIEHYPPDSTTEDHEYCLVNQELHDRARWTHIAEHEVLALVEAALDATNPEGAIHAQR